MIFSKGLPQIWGRWSRSLDKTKHISIVTLNISESGSKKMQTLGFKLLPSSNGTLDRERQGATGSHSGSDNSIFWCVWKWAVTQSMATLMNMFTIQLCFFGYPSFWQTRKGKRLLEMIQTNYCTSYSKQMTATCPKWSLLFQVEEQNLQEYLCGGLRSVACFSDIAVVPPPSTCSGQKQHTVVLQGAVQTLKHTLVSESQRVKEMCLKMWNFIYFKLFQYDCVPQMAILEETIRNCYWGGSCRFAMTPIVYCCKACPHNEWWWWLRALRWHAHTAKCGEAQEPQMHQTGQGELSKNCILGCFILGPWQRPHSFGGPNGWFELAIPFHLLVDHEFPHWLAASIELGYTNVVTLDVLTGLHTWFVTSRRSRNHGALLLTWIGRLDALGVKGKTSTEDWEYNAPTMGIWRFP